MCLCSAEILRVLLRSPSGTFLANYLVSFPPTQTVGDGRSAQSLRLPPLCRIKVFFCPTWDSKWTFVWQNEHEKLILFLMWPGFFSYIRSISGVSQSDLSLDLKWFCKNWEVLKWTGAKMMVYKYICPAASRKPLWAQLQRSGDKMLFDPTAEAWLGSHLYIQPLQIFSTKSNCQ